MGQSGADQIAIQRYLAADVAQTQKTALGGALMNSGVSVLLTTVGVGLYAFYANRGGDDPLCQISPSPNCTKAIDDMSADQIFPYFFMHEMPAGIAGVMIAAILGCTMSVFSSGLNAATTCTVVDLLQNVFRVQVEPEVHGAENLTAEEQEAEAEARQAALVLTSRKITAAFGLFTISVAMLSTVLGRGLVALSVAALGLTSGPVLGVFLLGMLTTRVGPPSCLLTFITGLLGMVYLAIGQAVCTKDDPCSGFLAIANLNEFVY